MEYLQSVLPASLSSKSFSTDRSSLDNQEQASPKATDQNRKIFVGNLNFRTNQDEVVELFSKFGEIEVRSDLRLLKSFWV